MSNGNTGTKRFGMAWYERIIDGFNNKKGSLKKPTGSPYFQQNSRLILIILIATLFISALSPSAAVAQNVNPATLIPGQVVADKTATPVTGMVNTWDMKLQFIAKDETVTSDTVLVIDTSGSMSGDRIAAAKEAAIQFVNDLLPNGNTTNRIALVSYSSNVTTNSGFVGASSRQTLINAINALYANGGTHTQGGIYRARSLLDAVPLAQKANQNQIVLLSDGQPTFGYGVDYDWRMNTANLIPYPGYGLQTPSTVPENQFLYTSPRVGDGTTMYLRYDNPYGTSYDKYYNLGNHAIAEAGFAKASDYLVYTVALQAGTVGNTVLQNMASPGKNYTANPADLNAIYGQIAGEISAAARNVSVLDPMGTGFTVVGNVISLNPSQGTATYDPVTKRVEWNAGTLSTICASPPQYDPCRPHIKMCQSDLSC